MNLITKDDSQYFEQTSDEPYVKQLYKVFMTNGDSYIFDNWESVQALWFQNASQFMSHVEVLDKPNSNTNKSKGGFK